jgi:hypothetical protein
LTIIESVLIYVGIPALVIVAVVGLVFAGDMRRGGNKRYRPGRPFEFRPVWFLSAPEHGTRDESSDHKALEANDAPAALPAGSAGAKGADVSRAWPAHESGQQSATGGASDRW